MAKEAKDKEASESSGLADIMEVAEAIGSPADSFAGAGITIARDDDDDDDDLTNLGGGFGGGGSAALVGGDDDDDLPAVSAFEPVALPSADPEPAPKSDKPAEKKKVALVEAPPPAAPKAKAEPKPKPKAPATKDASDDAVPVVTPATRAASTPPPTAATAANDEGGGSKMWIALLFLAVAGFGAWVAFGRTPAEAPKTPIAEATTPANVEPPEPIAEPEPPAVEPEPEEAAVVMDGSTGAAEEAATGGSGDAAAAEAGEEAEPEPDAKADWKTTRKLPRAKKEAAEPKADPPTEPPEPEPEPEPEPKPDPKPMTQAELDKKFSTECLLDPNKPGCDEFRKRQAAKLKDLDAHLPDKLSQNDIRGAVGSVKSKAKACGSQHGATAGETVRVKLSIEGATGKVMSASAMSPHDSTPLGKCVADVLSGATFPRFKSQQQGTTYPVTM